MKKLLLLSFVTLFILSSCSDESVLTPPENINAKNDSVMGKKNPFRISERTFLQEVIKKLLELLSSSRISSS